MRGRPGTQAIDGADLLLLQRCFDAIIARNQIDRKSAVGDLAAKSLLNAFAAGVRDREELIRIGEAELLRG